MVSQTSFLVTVLYWHLTYANSFLAWTWISPTHDLSWTRSGLLLIRNSSGWIFAKAFAYFGSKYVLYNMLSKTFMKTGEYIVVFSLLCMLLFVVLNFMKLDMRRQNHIDVRKYLDISMYFYFLGVFWMLICFFEMRKTIWKIVGKICFFFLISIADHFYLFF